MAAHICRTVSDSCRHFNIHSFTRIHHIAFVDSFVRPFVTAIIHAPDTCTSSFMRAARKLLNNVQNSCRPLVVVVVVVAVDVVPQTQQQQQQLIAHAYS